MAKQGIMLEIIVNYYTAQGKIWVYHRDVQFTAEVKDEQIMRLLESDVAKAISKRGKLRSQNHECRTTS